MITTTVDGTTTTETLDFRYDENGHQGNTVASYTDVYCSHKRVRYIAVSDRIDTNRDDKIAPFKNILNDMYAKDLSRKVKSAKRQRAYKGYYISAQAPSYRPWASEGK